MARARNIKPGFFQNESLVEHPFEVRLLFIGLWTLADKQGRLEDRPKKIKMGVFPADNVDVEKGLVLLSADKFIDRYEVDGVKYIQISNWNKHQNPHHTEKDSVIPPLNNGDVTVKPPKQDGGNPPDSLIHRFTDSLIHQEGGASTTPPTSTPSGRVCARIRKLGIQGVNPSNPKLLALLTAGVPEDEFVDLASEPQARGKGMAWILAAIEGRRRDAAGVSIPPAEAEKPPSVCVCCGAPASKRIGRDWFCSSHDQHSERVAA